MSPEVAYPEFRKFAPLAKVEDGPNGLATLYSVATSETIDADAELCDYPSTKVGYQDWSRESFEATTRAGQAVSLGPVRQQHGREIFGKAIQIDYLDDKKQIWLKAEAADAHTSDMLRRGIFVGLSQAGKYNWRRCNECGTDIPQKNFCPTCSKHVVVRYSARPSEVSVVDKPCNPDAYFLWVKANGSTELIKAVGKAEAKTKRVDGEDLTAGDFLIATDKDDPETWKLPWKFSSEEKTVSHLRNALARFGQLQDVPVDVKAKAWKRLVGLCKKHGIEVSDDEKKAAGASNVHGLICPACGEETEGGAEKCPKCGRAYQVDPGAGGQRKPSLGEPGDTGEALGTSGKAARHPTGRFASRASGELHDCLTAAGYEHTRTGTEAQVGPPAEPTATACYSHEDGRQRVTVREDGAWEHEDGKGRRVTGSGKDALAAHLAACGKAAGASGLALDLDGTAREEGGARKGTEQMTDIAVQELVKAEVAAAVAVAVPLQKDLSHVAYMSGILASMAQLRDMVDAEAKRENDDRDVAIALSLNRLIDDGSDILRDLVEDETTELTAPGGGDEEDEGPIQLAAAAKAVGAGSGAGIEAATAALNNL
jgi:predicted RNA-binding Zn-ribbon protein involved in translation (DUF1610 family)